MASLIFWFIVLIFIISSVVKGKKKPVNRNRNAGTTQSRPIPPAQKPRTQPAATQSVKKQQPPMDLISRRSQRQRRPRQNILRQKKQKPPNSVHGTRTDEHF